MGKMAKTRKNPAIKVSILAEKLKIKKDLS